MYLNILRRTIFFFKQLFNVPLAEGAFVLNYVFALSTTLVEKILNLKIYKGVISRYGNSNF